jgi:hypothetical protein
LQKFLTSEEAKKIFSRNGRSKHFAKVFNKRRDKKIFFRNEKSKHFAKVLNK